MSDKETAPWIRDWAWRIVSRTGLSHEAIPYLCEELTAFAVECRAPAPQTPMDRLPLLVDAVQKFLKHDGGPGSEDYDANEIYHARRSMQAAFGFRCPRCGETLPHLYDENCTDYRAATPQVTPCEHFWRTVAVNPRWSWFTECEKCKIGAPLELQAENYVEGTSEQSPQVTPELPLEQLKEIVETPIEDEWDTSEQASQDMPQFANCNVGPSCACGIWPHKDWCWMFTLKNKHTSTSEQASPTPDKCQKYGSSIQSVFGRDCTHDWHSSWHSSASSPKGTK